MMNHEGRVTRQPQLFTRRSQQTPTPKVAKCHDPCEKLVKKTENLGNSMKMKMIITPSRVRKCVNGLASKFLHIVPASINVQDIDLF